MSSRIQRSRSEQDRSILSWDERWKGDDQGLITCWEVGKKLRDKEPELAQRAEVGELPVLAWKGGVEPGTKQKKKFGTLFYLAQWQGLRGQDLDVDVSEETTLTCSSTGATVTYTSDTSRFDNS